MTVIVPIWQNKLTKKFFSRCWNCGEESIPSNDVAEAMKAARNHFKTCSEIDRWTTKSGRKSVMVGVEITFG